MQRDTLDKRLNLTLMCMMMIASKGLLTWLLCLSICMHIAKRALKVAMVRPVD